MLVGAAIGYLVRVPARVVATVMAFGAGVLLSAVSFDLIDGAYEPAGFAPAAIGATAGAILTMVADTMIPEAFEDAHLLIGLVTVAGFLTASALSAAGR